jgi:hypothetical protein
MTSTPMPSPGMTAIRYFFDMLCSSVKAFQGFRLLNGAYSIPVVASKMAALVKPLCTIRA